MTVGIIPCSASGFTLQSDSAFPRSALIKDIDFGALLADKAFDADWLRAELNERGALAVIPPKSNRTEIIDCDYHMYRWRHLVENFFCKLKQFRRVATRYDKTDCSYAAMINLTATVLVM